MSLNTEAVIKSLNDATLALDSPDITVAQKSQISAAAQNLLSKARSPFDSLMESLVTLVTLTSIRLFVKWKVFESIPIEGSISYKELAAKIGAETNLIARFGGVLVAARILNQTGSDHVSHTQTSKMLTTMNPFTAIIKMSFDTHLNCLANLPRYFTEYGLKEPVGQYHVPASYAAGDPTLTVWEHANRDPERKEAFIMSMVAMTERFPVTGSYDFSWLVAEAEKSDRKLLVDVGGGKGQAAQAIVEATPGLSYARCVVQDLAPTVEEAKKLAEGATKEFEFQVTDFHKEQPVKGASIYYIRRCLHDYGDSDSINILKHLRDAMTDDSRVLIVEQILTNPPTPMSAAMDIIMGTLGGKERTREGFEEITAAAGLKITKVCPAKGSDFAVIECMRT